MPGNRPRTLLSAILLAAASPAFAGGTPIPIVNPSFELPALPLCSFGAAATGWQGAAVWHCGIVNQCSFDAFPTGPSDGNQVAFTNSPFIPVAQTLSETLVAGETYVLRVDLGKRDDAFPMQDYRVRLLAGSTILVEDPGSLDPAPGTWETTTLVYTTPAKHPAIGQALKIELVFVAGGQGNFDNVRLTKGELPGLLGDLNGDGAVNAADLALLLGAWGSAGGAADLDGDGSVGAGDLAILLGAWTG